MEILVRELFADVDGTIRQQERELRGTTLTIGSSFHCDIQLIGVGVQRRHAQIKRAGSMLQLKALGSGTLSVDGKNLRTVKLGPGECVQIGAYEVCAIQAPTGFDAGIQLRSSGPITGVDLESSFVTQLDGTWLSIRAFAWFLGLTVLLAGLLIPLASLYEETGLNYWAMSPVDDAVWSSGPLHHAHQFATEGDCAACHVQPFQRVQDDVCESCHTALREHFDQSEHYDAGVRVDRCATCHREHGQPPNLVSRSEATCTQCHADSTSFVSEASHLEAVRNFSLVGHPAFEVVLDFPVVRPAGVGSLFEWRLEETELQQASQQSQLKFPHDVHLDPSAVQGLAGVGLSCADCHELSPDSEHFHPVTMEQHCQGCHELTFDDSAPLRQLPHGQPEEVINTLLGFHLGEVSDPSRQADDFQYRRVPDRPLRNASCADSAFECASARTERDVSIQFEQRGCVVCHTVEDTGVDDLFARYRVHPVRLTSDFMPFARFDHAAHLTQNGVQGDDACLSCHDANTSSVSSDVLVPNVDQCLQCHSAAGEADQVALDCVSCHDYHPKSAISGLVESRVL